jgi:chromate transporter
MPDQMDEPTRRARPVPLADLAGLFLRLGGTAFGGPAAHIAMMEEEVVVRRRWLTRDEFVDLLGATNLIPGPNSTELALHVGHRKAGWRGLLVAGTCFILPATLIVLALGWLYVRYGTRPAAIGLLYGIVPVILAVIVQALVRLARSALRTGALALLGAILAALALLGVHELILLFGAGLVGAAAAGRRGASGGAAARAFTAPGAAAGWAGGAAAVGAGAAGAGTAGVGATAVTFGLIPLSVFFLKVGAVLFGSGYVLYAFLRADLVERWHWLTDSQLLDAIAAGQVTPGPVFTTATFVGYLLGGPAAALVATAAIFLPAFVFVAASGPLIPRLRRSAVAGGFLDGVNVAALVLMAVVTLRLGRAAIVDLTTLLLAATSALALLRFRVNSGWLVLAGALVGLLSRSIL